MSFSEDAVAPSGPAGRFIGGGRSHRGKYLWEYVPEGKDRRLVHCIGLHYGLSPFPKVCRPFPSSYSEVQSFHTGSGSVFVSFPNERSDTLDAASPSDIGSCSIFQEKQAGFTMNWADGLYPNDSSGSVILNDVVLGVLDLLKSHERIIYIDVGVHHVDGVEKSFIRSPKVMTISFNKYGDFSSYMSTDIGIGRGKHHALNVSLGVRTKDDDFIGLFQTIIQKAISVFNPNLIVLQTGIESLAPDHADCFSLSAESHLRCLSILRIFGLPIMILGNIVHCWCSESGLLGKYNFGENQSVNDNVVKLNNTENLDEIRDRVLSHLAIIEEVPIKGFKDTDELQTEMIDDIIDDDIDWDREAYDFVEGLPARPKAWSNPFARQAAKAVNRIGRGLGSQQSVLMEYNDMLNPYTDFLNYVGHFDSVSDGCVTPALRTISTASRTIGSVSAFAGSMLKYGARALGKHGRSFQMIARPEAGLLGDGPKREQVLLVTSLEEVQAVITKWTYDELQDVKVDVPEDMPLEEAETIGAYLNIAKATELISDKSFLIQKIKRSVLKR